MRSAKKKFAILFPGQGAQYVGMCNKLIMESAIASDVFEEANQVLNFDLRSLILNGGFEALTLSENAQPAIVAASYALFRVLMEQTGEKPACVVGHSLGEISALIAAGALSFSDGLLYARERGKLMHSAIQEKKGRAGIVVDLDVETLTNLVDTICLTDYITISGHNSPKQFIVAGTQTALRALSDRVDEKGGEFIPFRMMPMKADAPYHSGLMAFLKPQFQALLETIQFKKPQFDVWSTVTGNLITSKKQIPDILAEQLVSSVCWNQVMGKIRQAGMELLVDIGPQSIMRNLVQENVALPMALAFDDAADKSQIIQQLTESTFKVRYAINDLQDEESVGSAFGFIPSAQVVGYATERQ